MRRRQFLRGCIGLALAPTMARPLWGQPTANPPSIDQLTPSPVKWIDVHMHLVPGRGADFVASARAAIDLMDRAGIAKAVVMPTPQPANARYDVAELKGALARYPGRFGLVGGGGSLNGLIHANPPARVTAALRARFKAEAERLLALGVIGFGEISILHLSLVENHPFEETAADHPLLLDLADIAAAHGVPIDLHLDLVTSEGPTPPALAGKGNPQRLKENISGFERLLAHNRSARIVLEHIGSDQLGFMDALTIGGLLERNDNLSIGLRVAPPAMPVQNKLLQPPRGFAPDWREVFQRHPTRIVLGSDSFAAGPNAGAGAGATFARGNVARLLATNRLLAISPPAFAERLASTNPLMVYPRLA